MINNNNSENVDTENDEAIARALESEEPQQHQAWNSTGRRSSHRTSTTSSASSLLPPSSSTVIVRGRRCLECPRHHNFLLSELPGIEMNQLFDCHNCGKSLTSNRDQHRHTYGCTQCHYRVCEQCFNQGEVLMESSSATANANTSSTRRTTSPVSAPRRTSFPGGYLVPPAGLPMGPPHMCYAPCVIGDICIELLVDTGASVSVMSYELAVQLNLQHLIDRSVQGMASGIGQAKIVGKLFNVLVELGQVEFRMDFAILDGTPDKLLLLGLDLMRQYKCIVDLESNVLIFGGKDGVQVPLLPADEEQERAFRSAIDHGCTIN